MSRTKTFTITADDETINALDMFFGMLHFNNGHSGIFGINFDGDGDSHLKMDPEPDERLRSWVSLINKWGKGVEVADGEMGYYSVGGSHWPARHIESHKNGNEVELQLVEYETYESWLNRKGKVLDTRKYPKIEPKPQCSSTTEEAI